MMLKAEPIIKQSGNSRETLKGDTREVDTRGGNRGTRGGNRGGNRGGRGGRGGGRCIFELPFPPSVNHYWRRVGPRVLISKEGRRFRDVVCGILQEAQTEPIAGRLSITVRAFPPDKRRRDLDNLLKSLLDALEHGGAYINDNQIDDLRIQRGGVVDNGMVVVEIGELINVNK